MPASPARPGLAAYYLLEGLNALGTNVFFLGIFFHARISHGFSDTANLLLAATQGAAYVAATRAGGRLADRVGPERSVAAGLTGMSLALLAGWLLPQGWGLFVAIGTYSASTALTWPALEAAIARAPSRVLLARRTGLYNIVWSLVGAAGFFLSGPLFALDPDTVFRAPLAAHALQLAGLAWWGGLRRADRREHDGGAQRQDPEGHGLGAKRWRGAGDPDGAQPQASTDGGAQRQDPAVHGAGAKGWRAAADPDGHARYLRSAWVANGLGYFLFGAFSALAPALGERLGLDPRRAIWLLSTYLFARSAAFVLLWRWTGWQYRAGWLIAALALPPAALAALFAAPAAGAAILALALLGALSGVAYSASLHASLDRGGREGEGGGLHEWVIGLGILLGPLAGAAGIAQSGTLGGAGAIVAALGGVAALAGLAPLATRSTRR